MCSTEEGKSTSNGVVVVDHLLAARAVADVLFVHAAVLFACGWYGAVRGNWTAHVMYLALIGTCTGGLIAACGALCRTGSAKYFEIGVTSALVLQVVFAAIFAVQAYCSYGVKGRHAHWPVFAAMAVVSAVAPGAVRAEKAKPTKEEKKEEKSD